MALEFVAAAEKNKSHTPSDIFGVPFSFAEALIENYMETGEILNKTPSWAGQELVLSVETRGAILTKLNRALSDKQTEGRTTFYRK